ncbi:cyclase family protein [Methanomicrobium antiquum]|uniref:Cyclase family protein n=1 Tax=Methanomicrobium antiquum TaxID=487686 RepID=A0AAF0FQT8_9EURY|nr:cyclase family protein [Methanomicrobium antiquum]WFN36141.1 cyclase family protein [Methanomicrobium antiquum]
MPSYDITRELSESTIIYPGDPEIKINPIDDCGCRVSKVCFSSHSGTHIDAPSHYLKSAMTVDRIPVSVLTGEARVIDLTTVEGSIGRYDLKGKVLGAKRVLLKTAFSGKHVFEEDFPHITYEAAAYLKEQGVFLIGIDSPSIEMYKGDGSVHKILLMSNIVIIELLDLSVVNEGIYRMCALPLRFKGLDGSPARVILSDDNLLINPGIKR